ncbi:MAG: hypothetical protein ACE5F6_20565, partial [Anaerolineae bacterium]
MKHQTVEPRSSDSEPGLNISLRLREMTVRAALAGLIIIVAVLARLFALGGRPFGAAEAARALAALRFVQGQPADLTAFSPPLTNLNLLLFFVTGAGDFWARLAPALFGITLVALPMLRFRHRLGTGGALAAAALITLSPTFLLFSRSVDPALLSAVTSLLFVGAV